MDVEGEALQRAWLGRFFRCISDDKQLVGLANDLGAERGKLGVSEIKHVVITKLLSVEPARHGFRVEVNVSRQGRGKARRIHGCDLAKAGEGAGKPLAKVVRYGEAARTDHGKRAGMGQALLVAGERVGEAPGKRHGDRLQDDRVPLGEGRELRLGQFEHDRVAQRRDGCGADAVGEEADLADGRAAPHLSDAASVDVDGETARGDEIERVGSVALAHENLAAGDGLRDEQLLELGKVLRRQVAEGFDQRKRGCPSGISCLRRLSVAHGGPRLPTGGLRRE